MCGIHGFTWPNQEKIDEMVELSYRRGPDANDTYVDDNISLGHNLLAITEEPTVSKQPWVLADRWILCYNGEIYNYKELKQGLEKKGYVFETDSDTEVLAKGLSTYGIDFIKRLDGMYAIAWYDKSEQTITLARDNTGVKPLYYSQDIGRTMF